MGWQKRGKRIKHENTGTVYMEKAKEKKERRT